MNSLKDTIIKLLAECDGECSRQQGIALAIVEKAMKGDLHAAAFIRDLTEQKKEKEATKEGVHTVTVRVVN